MFHQTRQLNRDHLWVLRRLHNVGYTSAVIAGGAVRDAYFKRPMSDVDIFYWHSDFSPEEVQPKRIEQNPDTVQDLFDIDADFEDDRLMLFDDFEVLYSKHLRKSTNNKKSGYGSERIFSIIQMEKDEQIYQLVALEIEPLQYVREHFDINLCRCWCDGVRMRYPNTFLTDARNRTMTIEGKLTRREYQYATTIHVPKLKEKFPNFTVVDLLKNTYNT